MALDLGVDFSKQIRAADMEREVIEVERSMFVIESDT